MVMMHSPQPLALHCMHKLLSRNYGELSDEASKQLPFPPEKQRETATSFAAAGPASPVRSVRISSMVPGEAEVL